MKFHLIFFPEVIRHGVRGREQVEFIMYPVPPVKLISIFSIFSSTQKPAYVLGKDIKKE